MANATTHLANGALEAVGHDLTAKVIQNPQTQVALQRTADGIVQGGVALAGGVVAAGAVTAAAVAVAVPAVLIGATVYWLLGGFDS